MNPTRFKELFLCRSLMPIVLLLLLTACAAHDKEMVIFDRFDNSWKYLKTETNNNMEIVTYVSENNRNDMLELMNTDRKKFPAGTVKEAQAQLLKIRLDSCPDTRSEIIEQDTNSIIYEMFTDSCRNIQNDYSLTRILYGENQVFIIIFSRQVEEISDQQKNEWLKDARSAIIRSKLRQALIKASNS